MKIKRSFSAILCLIMLLAVMSAAIPGASAADATYKMSTQYKEGKYYTNFSAVTLTGDQAADVLAIALSQLGYREGDSNDGLGGESGGDRDFVEFNVLYGKIDNNQGNGLSYGYYWCASFVNWCLREANVSKEASATGEISCRRWLSACKTAGIYIDKGQLPQSGDLIFFKDEGSEVTSTHMGIVRYCDGKRVYTIEGNTVGEEYSSDGDRVALKSYALTSSYIVGYARPKYEKNVDAKVDHTGKSLTKGLYISKEEIEIYDDENLTVSAGKIGENEVFTVIGRKNGLFKISYQSGCEIYEGYADISGRALQLNSTESACRISYLDGDGTSLLPDSFADAGVENILSADRIAAEGKGLAGWAETPNADKAVYAVGGNIDPAADTCFYAVWDYTRYDITFMTEQGEKIKTVSGYLGDEITPPDITAPEGYIFTGWGEDFSSTITGSHTYYAVFEKAPAEDEENTAEIASEKSSENSTEAYTDKDGSLEIDIFENRGCKAGINSLAIVFCAAAGALCAIREKKREK